MAGLVPAISFMGFGDAPTDDAAHPLPLRVTGRMALSSAAPRRLDRGDVYLLHTHHHIKCALGFIATSG
jgi:hypothetical protein